MIKNLNLFFDPIQNHYQHLQTASEQEESSLLGGDIDKTRQDVLMVGSRVYQNFLYIQTILTFKQYF